MFDRVGRKAVHGGLSTSSGEVSMSEPYRRLVG